ncbi:hypothetical protein K9F62_03145 [Desulfovibrio sp. JY]|nr:hypothetical protein K9F62_03145 [Desulfovibrio sp. JY]
MSEAELKAYVFNCLEQFGEEEGRRILLRKLETDREFEEAATRYGLRLGATVAESWGATKQ